ncbi:MAG TPA: hypothetical protein VN703_00535 [Candidatus Sulfopaludibacter sp.]|nr:hypothetical protein [Candidatus Sulfopaludibacter sp.]
MMSILKTGYENGKKVPRVNLNTNKQELFHTFGLKVILAERNLNPTVAKGVLNRTFVISNYKGAPPAQYKVNEKSKTYLS